MLKLRARSWLWVFRISAGMQGLDDFLLFSHVRIQNWSSWHSNQYPYGMLAAWVEALATMPQCQLPKLICLQPILPVFLPILPHVPSVRFFELNLGKCTKYSYVVTFILHDFLKIVTFFFPTLPSRKIPHFNQQLVTCFAGFILSGWSLQPELAET